LGEVDGSGRERFNEQVKLSIVCSSRAGALTRRLRERLQRNLGIETLVIEEDDAPVWETWEEGAAADAMLIVLDGANAPAPVRRENWDALLAYDGTPPAAFLRLEDCAYPPLLERRKFIGPGDMPAHERQVERWVAALLPECPDVEPEPVNAAYPEEWWEQLADRPGQAVTDDADAAHAFAHAARRHFQGVVWVGGQDRPAAVVKAELEYRLRGERMLAVVAHIDKPLPLDETRHSVIQVRGAIPAGEADSLLGACYGPVFPGWFAEKLGANVRGAVLLDRKRELYRMRVRPKAPGAARQAHLECLAAEFGQWKTDPARCRELLGEVAAALDYGLAADWDRAHVLCRRAAFVLLGYGRRREGIRLFHRLLLAAEERGDTDAAAEARHELSWLTDEDAPPRQEIGTGEQMTLNLLA
jgi:hypothetical protein